MSSLLSVIMDFYWRALQVGQNVVGSEFSSISLSKQGEIRPRFVCLQPHQARPPVALQTSANGTRCSLCWRIVRWGRTCCSSMQMTSSRWRLDHCGEKCSGESTSAHPSSTSRYRNRKLIFIESSHDGPNCEKGKVLVSSKVQPRVPSHQLNLSNMCEFVWCCLCEQTGDLFSREHTWKRLKGCSLISRSWDDPLLQSWTFRTHVLVVDAEDGC